MADKNEKLKRILTGISRSDMSDVFGPLQKEMQRASALLAENVDRKSSEVIVRKVREFKSQIDSILIILAQLRTELSKSDGEVSTILNQKLFELKSAMDLYRTAGLKEMGKLSLQMDGLKNDIRTLSAGKVSVTEFNGLVASIERKMEGTVLFLKNNNKEQASKTLDESKKTITDLSKEIKKLRQDTMSALSADRGGSMNRNISVSGNSSALSRYTDINLKPGNNVTISYQNNDNLKTTDITIAASGGGGGTSRNISTVSVSSVVAATASTDIVVIAGAGIQLTMPTAAGNTNLYTIKNKVASSVLVVPNGAETIDGQSNVILAVQYVSIDLISDGANWQIT